MESDFRFKNTTGKLHHLLSTSATPGVFNKNRDKMSFLIQNESLEYHIKSNGRDRIKGKTNHETRDDKEMTRFPPITPPHVNKWSLSGRRQDVIPQPE
eukprot:TRINITY_DN12978_c0_g1_i1.p1 TRINITY_DN12978_c0_g1~~TRINITY_DN12978_c0_g1_i1.p1  ORF type:complete len:110 (-),score=19.18 TRINITY_DN12978_c0_g1_i1:140-433(-)